ncbi:type IV secretory system conjugative DNA transfer family protein [Thalassobius sp. Cn5-15]|uniref:type IV secretory system conjugative DNA transfer family protein n=1 Tax=Thalassobius sp. Cn5-15 TaxID=2917763 RepID=UPI001EF1E879|nr:type IV secretory system conjugative DNA transfer family protein [Thalassobius sp. Cn5-15]MCG7492497.1 type IV secretory system conjugative DNA transfer family protein [Thalassobius sp. Cn5-15]
MHVATDPEEDGGRHLPRVRELLVQDVTELDKTFTKMKKSMHPIVKSTGARSLQKEEKLKASVIATAQAHTHFLDSDRIAKNMKVSSFKFEDLKTKPMTIYLVLPSDRLNTFGRWLRLLVQQAITVNARNLETKPDNSILFLLDEFAALGRLTMVEQAYGLMAGYGMQLWGIVQDFNQLDRIYDKGWQSFVSNSGMINYFGSSDKMTADYFSSLCGETTVWSFSSAVSNTFGAGSNSSSESSTYTPAQRKLAFPDELMRFPQTHQIAFLENMHPLRATKVKWFEDTELKALGRSLHD